MHSFARRYATYAYAPLGLGVAYAVMGAFWPPSWIRWMLIVLGVGALITAALLFIIAWRARHNPLASGSDWEPLPPVMPPDPRSPAGAPVPAPPHPPIIPGPTAVALPIPRESVRVPSCWPADTHRESREPVAVAPLPGVRPPLRALPPPAEAPRDPGIIQFRPRGRRPGDPKR